MAIPAALFILFFLPRTQKHPGLGSVTTLYQDQQPQQNTLIGGRGMKWHAYQSGRLRRPAIPWFNLRSKGPDYLDPNLLEQPKNNWRVNRYP